MQTLICVKEEKGEKYWKFEDTGQDLTESIPEEKKIRVHTLVISDTHLGTSAFRARALLATLNTFWVEKYFILLGDIFDDHNFKRLSSSHWKVLSRIRKLTKPDKELDEIWIEGNHDNTVMAGVMGAIVGLDVKQEFEWECGGKKYLAIHGDIFHFFLARYPVMTKIVIQFYSFIQYLDPLNRHIGCYLSHKTGEWNDEHKQVAEGATQHAKSKSVNYVICGHTHLAVREKYDSVEYLNTGCWVKNPCSFVTITEDGPILNHVSLH